MRLLFLDDARQPNCNREKMGPLVAVGGISVDEKSLRPLESELDDLCKYFGFPEHEVFKWSPGRNLWMRKKLVGERRTEFFQLALAIAEKHDAVGQVTVADSNHNMATRKARSHEMDVFVMALERLDASLSASDISLVVVARPPGGRSDEDNFLADCAEMVGEGTEYSSFARMGIKPVTMPFPNSRLLQVADLVVSISTAMVAGHEEFAGPVFPNVRSILRRSSGRYGGAGLKIHPDYVYANLYHWILGDSTFWRRGMGLGYPLKDRPFFESAYKY